MLQKRPKCFLFQNSLQKYLKWQKERFRALFVQINSNPGLKDPLKVVHFSPHHLSKLIENDPFLGENLNPPINPIELGKVMMIGAHPFEHIIHPPLFPHVAYFHPKGVYRYFHPHLILSVGKTSLFQLNKGRVRLVTRTKTSASWEATHVLCVFICLIVICFHMHALFLLLVDHVSN
jgi:hypothetical protein